MMADSGDLRCGFSKDMRTALVELKALQIWAESLIKVIKIIGSTL